MSRFASRLAPFMEEMIEYQEALGYLRVTYERRLLDFDRFCAEHYPEKAELEQQMVLEWLQKRPTESANYLGARATIVRMLGAYMAEQGHDAYVLPEKFVGGHRTGTPYLFTNQELSSLFCAADQTPPDMLSVLLRLIYTCGLRPKEGRVLQWNEVSLNTGEIIITGTKRQRERIVVMSDDMLDLCRSYRAKQQLLHPESTYLFPSKNGGCYSKDWLSGHFRVCWERANQGAKSNSLPRVRVYDLRHRFASAVLCRWLEEKRSLNAMLPYLSAYMGHDSLDATAYYIHLLPENLMKSPGIDWNGLLAVVPEVEG